MWGYIDEQKVILENILSLQRDTFSTLSKTFITPEEFLTKTDKTCLSIYITPKIYL